MRKKLAVSLALIAALALGATQASGGADAPQKIAKLSHNHPTGTTYSFFCGKLRGIPGRRYVAEAIGPAVREPRSVTVRMNRDGGARARFKIDQAGPHEMVLLRRGTEIDRKSYVVPHGKGAPVDGPFRCGR